MKKLVTLSLLAFGFLPLVKAQSPNWSEDVASIFYTSCVKCHNPTGIAPFSLLDYQNAYNNRFSIQSMTSARLMPPWTPNPSYRHFAQERVLSQDDINKISDWVNNGAPQGDPLLAPTPPVINNSAEIINPDFNEKIPDYLVNTASDLYRCFVIPTGLSSTKYITEIELIPGNRQIVHHVLLFKDASSTPANLDAADPGPGYTNFGGTGSSSSQLIALWAPGSDAYKLPAGMGIKLEANTNLVLQIHYPGGTFNKTDSTRVRIKYATGIQREVALDPALNHGPTLVNGPLFIPANTTRTFNAAYTVPITVTALAVAPHMHLIGRTIKSYAVTPTNDTIPFFDIPEWDFRWQGMYRFRNLVKIPAGTTLYSSAFYDNTNNNPLNPNNPPQHVFLGEATEDEMMLIYFSYTLYQQGDENVVIDSSEVVHVGFEEYGNSIVTTLQLYDPFPNPANDELTVSFFIPESGNLSMRIYNLSGQLVNTPMTDQHYGLGHNSTNISLQSLAAGTYILQMQSGNVYRNKKFVKD